MKVTRRTSFGLGGLVLSSAAMGGQPMTAGADAVAADLTRYVGFGNKAAGGAGDEAAARWIAGELAAAGFKVERHDVDVPWFEASSATLALADQQAAVLPLPIVVPTAGIAGRLVTVRADIPIAGSLAGAIALIDLPYGRWSSAMVKAIRGPLDAAMGAGAAAAVIVTTGPTGEAIALNVDGNTPMAPRPAAIIGSTAARPFLVAAAAGGTATLRVAGKGGRRPAANLAARLDRGKGRWLVISTPRSGWTACAGERGPGIAAFLALARMAAKRWTGHDLLFLCNGGHEYENLGAEHAIARAAPPPAATALWLHLGANVAARDWHETAIGKLSPLPSADPQRYLVTSESLVARARSCFAGLPGLEAAYPTSAGAAGELATIMAAGYSRVAGIFGAHRYHHVAGDDARCIEPSLVARLMPAFTSFIDQALRQS